MSQAFAAGPLARMRVLMLVTLLCTIIGLSVVVASRGISTERLAFALTAAPVVLLAWYWERRPPWWIVTVSVVPPLVFWVFSVAAHDRMVAVAVPALALSLAMLHVPDRRVLVGVTTLAVLLVPVVVGAVMRPDLEWGSWLLISTACVLVVIVVAEASRISWTLTLQLEEARQMEGELATVQERFRVASELHDIQGHTLHVARLTIQLARRLLENDPTAAARHLSSAESLIGETLAETRQIVVAEREMDTWRELANARSIAEAAGIAWTVEGCPEGHEDQLFAVMIREGSTNLLRHAHSTWVAVRFGQRSVSIANDGANGSIGPLGGLAVLSRRFETAGGSLSTRLHAGEFTVTGTLP